MPFRVLTCVRANILPIFVAVKSKSYVMARGNLFLGMGRGSIGDVTFYRADGQQLSRVRNRKPKNPKTNAQLYQRAIMATVVKAYQSGKEIFDHSFQGISVGAGCQREFLRLNARLLRQLVANDINQSLPTAEQLARVVSPGANTPVADPFIISRGTYEQRLWLLEASSFSYTMPEPEGAGGEPIKDYAARVGLVPGDIYTFIAFAEREEIAYESPYSDDAVAWLNYCDFGWVRMIAKPDVLTSDEQANTLSDLFDFQASGGVFASSVAAIGALGIGSAVNLFSLVGDGSPYLGTGALGVIRSRLDQDLRSDSVMIVNYGSSADDMFGIASEYLLQTWSAGTVQVGESDLILEGGDG